MPNANAVAALAARLRVTMMSAEVSANDRLACSMRSPRTSPTCHARTRGAGNATIESARAAGAAIESATTASASVRVARLESATAASESVASERSPRAAARSSSAASESVASEWMPMIAIDVRRSATC